MLKSNDNVMIVVLMVTAAILGVMLWTSLETPAQANMSAAADRDYQMATGAITNTDDALYIIDTARQRMLVYYADANNNTFRVIDSVDLSRVFR